MLQSMGSQRVGHNFASEQHQIDNVIKLEFSLVSFLSQRTQLDIDGVSSVASNSLRPHGLQHTRLPCPSPTPGVYSNSCPSSW